MRVIQGIGLTLIPALCVAWGCRNTNGDDGPCDVGPCAYPDAPYGLSVESTIEPMAWPEAMSGSDTFSEVADLTALHCEPAVNSIFIQIAATYCTTCPARMQEIASLQDVWEQYGVRWIFIINDVTTASAANDYVERYGITFGFRTADKDNTAGADTIGHSSLFSAVPWTGVIRTSDMVLTHDEPDDSYLNLEAIAREHDGE